MTSIPLKRWPLILVSLSLMGVLLYVISNHEQGDHLSLADSQFYRLSDQAVVRFDVLLEDIKGVPLVLVGELHDQPSNHWAQLQIIEGLFKAGSKVAVGLEMFRADYQDELDRWVNGELTENEFVPFYLRNWGFDWQLYADIFRFSRDNKLPMIGLNVPRRVTRQVARSGFSSLREEQFKEIPPVACDVDKVYQDFIRRALGVPGKGGLKFQYFCEAQIVWDSAMAWYSLTFLKENPESILVILAGSGHSWKRGIPEQIRRQSELPYRVILPENPRLNRDNVTHDDTDYLWLDLPLVH